MNEFKSMMLNLHECAAAVWVCLGNVNPRLQSVDAVPIRVEEGTAVALRLVEALESDRGRGSAGISCHGTHHLIRYVDKM